ncbi:general transcription factor 3C polypeptide 6-like [Chenopodium quinoa]|uniref:general transcription factor 3C polypeptide 6-like n=1 Tax=Chenopodium quinoa TaxID=63459 RepID=UPI000B78C8C9|nr:general transcription factor 3C polypeptide 6-like [Chenopodium quinoa]
MELGATNIDHNQQDEYVLLNLDAVCGQLDISPNEPYILSGLDTANPILTIGDKLKLIGEYEETIGTCLIFSEKERAPLIHEETGSSDANLFKGTCIVDPNQGQSKNIKPVTSLHKILKFRLLSEADGQNLADNSNNLIGQEGNQNCER